MSIFNISFHNEKKRRIKNCVLNNLNLNLKIKIYSLAINYFTNMKKKILLLFTIALLSFENASAQAIIFTAKKYIEYHPEYAEWDEWPDEWTSIDAESDLKMTITSLVKGKIYKVIFYNYGEELASITVRYDAALSEKKRVEWDDKYVNCYTDDNGDYLYAQKVSLQSLLDDNSTWATNEESMIYFWFLSENYALALK